MLPEDAVDLEAIAARLQVPATVLVRQIIAGYVQQARGAMPRRNGAEHREVA